MMKKTLMSRIGIFISAFIVIMACSRNDSSPKEVEDQLSQAQEEVVVEAVLQRIDDQIDKEISMLENFNYNPSAAKSGDPEACNAKVTVVTLANSKFPKTITLDYGTGCTDKDKNFRAGKVVVSISGPYWEKGTVREAKLVDYKFNDLKISGLRQETNMGANDKKYIVFVVKHSEKILNEKDVLVVEREWKRERTCNRGTDFKTNTDDEVWITGSGTVKKDGKVITKDITTPLYRPLSCQHFQSGTIVTIINKEKTGELNYGTYEKDKCDNNATWWNGKVTKPIVLKTWINHYAVKP